MAEIITSTGKKEKGKRCKKLSTRVDLTPMVDLGFLLITFFVFTTTLSANQAMEIPLPKDPDKNDSTQVSKERSMQIVAGANNNIIYYYGDEIADNHPANYSESSIRKAILDKKKEVWQKFGDKGKLFVTIKMTDGATYENMVALIDEMLINDVKSYMILDADPVEEQLFTVPK